MKTTIVRLIAILLLAPVFVATSGCVAVAAGAAAGTVAWIRGALEANVDAPIERVGKAANETMREMKFVLGSSKVDAISGEVIAWTAQDTKVEIQLKKLTDRSTKISIRVGIFGEQAVSQQIYDELRKNL